MLRQLFWLPVYVTLLALLVASTISMFSGSLSNSMMFLKRGENVTYVCGVLGVGPSPIFFYKYRKMGEKLVSLLGAMDIDDATFKLYELAKRGRVNYLFSWEVVGCNETLCRVRLAYTIVLKLNNTYRLTVVEHVYVDEKGRVYYGGRYVGVWPFKLPEYKLYEGASVVLVGAPPLGVLKPLTNPVKLVSVVRLNTSHILHMDIRDVVKKVGIDQRRLLVGVACLDIYDPSKVSKPVILVLRRILPFNCTIKQYNSTKYYEEERSHANILYRRYALPGMYIRVLTGSPEFLHMSAFVYDVETGYAIAFALTSDYIVDVFANVFHLSAVDTTSCPLYIMLRRPTSYAIMRFNASPYLVLALILPLLGLALYAAKRGRMLGRGRSQH